jgi:hypothetical protein
MEDFFSILLEIQSQVKLCMQGASIHPSWFSEAQALLYNSTRFLPLCLA